MKNRLLIFLLISLSLPSLAAQWTVNQDHSEVMFQVPYLAVSELTGRFNSFRGVMQVSDDGQKLEKVQVSISTASIDTGNKIRDGHLQKTDFFQTHKYPHIHFQSDRIAVIGPSQYRATGSLQIRGIARQQSIEFSLSGPLKDTWGYENMFVRFNSNVRRDDFGLSWNKTLNGDKYLVGEAVRFWGTFQLQPYLGKTPMSKYMIPDTKSIRERERVIRGEAPAALVLATQAESIRVIKDAKALALTENRVGTTTNQITGPQEFWWWVALLVLGLMGFFSVLIISYHSKAFLVDRFPQYEENGRWGYVSDVVVILYVLIYSVAIWFVGWGVR